MSDQPAKPSSRTPSLRDRIDRSKKPDYITFDQDQGAKVFMLVALFNRTLQGQPLSESMLNHARHLMQDRDVRGLWDKIDERSLLIED